MQSVANEYAVSLRRGDPTWQLIYPSTKAPWNFADDEASADDESARPGFSEHQTGLAVDVGMANATCEVDQCFGATPAGKWVAANGYKYGFIVRYPQGLSDITGYEYEPWHLRYVGVGLATEMHNKAVQTLEQFFDLPAATDY